MKAKHGHITFILALMLKEAIGCHQTTQSSPTSPPAVTDSVDYADTILTIRTKRQTVDSAIRDDGRIEEFFVQCIHDFLGTSNLDVRTVVRFTLAETLWYQVTDQEFCSRQDDARCWNMMLSRYLNTNSQLLKVASNCINIYEMRRRKQSTGIPTHQIQVPYRHSGSYYQRQRRQASRGIALDEALIASELRRTLPPFIGDISTVIALAKDYTQCSPGICDCTGILLPSGEICGQFWYTRIAALTRLDKGTRVAISTVMSSAIRRAQQAKQRNRRRGKVLLIIWWISWRRVVPTTPTTLPEPTLSTPSTPLVIISSPMQTLSVFYTRGISGCQAPCDD